MICKGSTYYIIFLLGEKEVCAELTSVRDDSFITTDLRAKSEALYRFIHPENFVCITEDRPDLELIEDFSELM